MTRPVGTQRELEARRRLAVALLRLGHSVSKVAQVLMSGQVQFTAGRTLMKPMATLVSPQNQSKADPRPSYPTNS